jgi:hypothetical protein
MHPDTKEFNDAQRRLIGRSVTSGDQIDRKLPKAENKIWHAQPVGSWMETLLLGTASLRIVSGCSSGAANPSKRRTEEGRDLQSR